MGALNDAVLSVVPVRVYYEDTDFSGAVYHANYLKFMERGRTEWLRAAGWGQRAMFTAGAGAFVVARLSIEYRKPAVMDDLLDVTTSLSAVSGASVDLQQMVRRGEETLATGTVTLAWIVAGRPRRLPAALALALTER